MNNAKKELKEKGKERNKIKRTVLKVAILH